MSVFVILTTASTEPSFCLTKSTYGNAVVAGAVAVFGFPYEESLLMRAPLKPAPVQVWQLFSRPVGDFASLSRLTCISIRQFGWPVVDADYEKKMVFIEILQEPPDRRVVSSTECVR